VIVGTNFARKTEKN